MASRKARPRTVGQMLRDTRERKGEDGKAMPKTEAVRALGLGGRQTYYHWEDDYVVPSLEHAQAIAEFCEVPIEEVVNDILRRKGLRTYDDYLKMKSASQQATLHARSTGTIPGLLSRRVPRTGRKPGTLRAKRLNIQSTGLVQSAMTRDFGPGFAAVPSLGLQ